MRNQREPRVVKMWPLVVMLVLLAGRAGWLRGEPLTPEQATAERAAIERDIKREFGTLCTIAGERARLNRDDLRGRRVACVISSVDVRFQSDVRATYTITYACGIAPWQPERQPVVATPTVPLELLKEHGTWMLNAFL